MNTRAGRGVVSATYPTLPYPTPTGSVVGVGGPWSVVGGQWLVVVPFAVPRPSSSPFSAPSRSHLRLFSLIKTHVSASVYIRVTNYVS